MRDDVAMAVRAGYPALPLSVEDVEPEFHVVVRDGNRRGIRLERFFWTALKQFAQSRKSTLGQTVDEISSVAPETGNLTSAIRVACARWLRQAGECADGEGGAAGKQQRAKAGGRVKHFVAS